MLLDTTLALRARQAARVLNLSPRFLFELTKSGVIPHVRVGRAVLYPVAGLQAWLAQQAVGGAKDDGQRPARS
jgi:excisionase family DNA binding protein